MQERLRFAARLLLTAFFLLAGAWHFTMPEYYLAILPPWVPFPLFTVYASGVAEMALGLLVQVPRLRVFAGWGLIALLVVIFPANVHMALHPEAYPAIPPALLWARLPFQALFIAWASWSTRPPPEN